MGTEFLWKAAETAAPGENDCVTVWAFPSLESRYYWELFSLKSAI